MLFLVPAMFQSIFPIEPLSNMYPVMVSVFQEWGRCHSSLVKAKYALRLRSQLRTRQWRRIWCATVPERPPHPRVLSLIPVLPQVYLKV